MKYFILIWALNINFQMCFAQNLIINGDFETHSLCPTNGDINYASPWTNGSSLSPTLFDSCVNSTSLYFGVPTNADSTLSYQIPRSGHAYANFVAFSQTTPETRTYLKYEFTNPLNENKKYCLTFHVNLMNYSRYAIDGLGAFFTDSSIYCPTSACVLNCSPQVFNPFGNIISDTLGWSQISGCFTASANLKYMIIGNFSRDSSVQKDTNRYVSWDWSTNYFIDDVSLYEDSTNGVDEIVKENEISVFPSPANSLLSIETKMEIEELQLFDVSCKLVLQVQHSKTIDVSGISDGIYLLRCGFKEGDFSYTKIAVQHEK